MKIAKMIILLSSNEPGNNWKGMILRVLHQYPHALQNKNCAGIENKLGYQVGKSRSHGKAKMEYKKKDIFFTNIIAAKAKI
jgi:hypothetical protein